ncbi:MAG: hypothetical protein J6A02_02555 [Prevotella sp.]|nr:hypothetical protein [Prevotella sp.]
MKKIKSVLTALLLGSAVSGFAQTDGEYYLYDVNNKLFLSRGAAWGTEAIVDKYGIPFIWNSSEGSIKFKDNDQYLYNSEGEGLYTDRASTGFYFTETEGGYYLQDKPNNTYVTFSNGGYGYYAHRTTDVASACVWQLKTKAEHDAIVAGYVNENYNNVINASGIDATADNFIAVLASYAAKDYTSSISTARFAGNVGGWTFTQVRNQDNQPAYGTDFCELWQATGNYSQTIEGLKPGIYKVTVQGFERSGGWSKCNTLAAEGYEITTTTLSANDEQVAFKSWYSDKTDENTPNGTGAAVTKFNEGKYQNEVYAYVGEDGKLTITVSKRSHVGDNWVLFNNFTLTYYSDEVSEEDATELLASVPTEEMNAEVEAALNSAKSAFEADKTIGNYNALKEAIEKANASVEEYAKLKQALDNADKVKTEIAGNQPTYQETFNTNISTISDAYVNGTITYDGITAKINDVNNEVVKLIKSQSIIGSDVTAALPGADCKSLGNWTITGATLSGILKFQLNTWSTEDDATGMIQPFIEYWLNGNQGRGIDDATISYAATGLLPNSIYKVEVLVRQYYEPSADKKLTGATMFVGDYQVDACTGTEKEFNNKSVRYGTYTLEGKTDESGNLTFGFIIKDATFNWIAFKNLTVVYTGTEASESDFTALEAAIATAENNIKNLGFEEGEYAPYKNHNAINTIPVAKAIDKAKLNSASNINDLTNKLNAWTINTEEVNAVANGDFANTPSTAAEFYTTGWIRTNGWGQIRNDAEHATSGFAYYNQPGNLQYGNSELIGYTMPLKANTVYLLTFKYAAWDKNTSVKASVLNSNNEGMQVRQYASTDKNYKDGFINASAVFMTGEAGNYVLTLNNNVNIVITDVVLKKAVKEELVIDEAATYTPADKYADVTLKRTLIEGWNGLVLPFDMTVEDVKTTFNASAVKAFSSIANGENAVTLGFEDATKVSAGQPVMIKATAGSEYTIENVLLSADAALKTVAKEDGTAKFVFTGTYAPTTLTDVSFVLINGTKYYYHEAGTTETSAKAFRGYFVDESTEASAAKSVIFDFNEATGIENVNAAINNADNGAVYDLQGRRVVKPSKGIYVANGKKVVIK